MMDDLKFATPSVAELEAIKAIYTEAFPIDEQRPWELLAAMSGEPVLHAIKRADEVIGMISYWDFGKYVYIEHFAIAADKRNGGTGAKVLDEFARKIAKPLVLEAERPEDGNPMAERRIGFYRRHGFEILPYEYVQPPYAPGLASVPLHLMSTDVLLDAEEIKNALHTKVYKAL